VAVEFDSKLTDLAADMLRDAVQVYDPSERWLSGIGPALMALNTGTPGGIDATGAFSAVTGSMPAITGSFAALTGSIPALTGSFKAGAEGAEPEPLVTLKRVFKLPSRLPGVRLPAAAELAANARTTPTMARLDALARWIGPDGRLVGEDDELSDADAADACGALGIRPHYLPYLWEYALASGWFELEDSKDGKRTWAVIGPTAWRWADGDDTGALHVWAAVFAAVLTRTLDVAAMADERASRKLSFQGQGAALAVMLFLTRRTGMTVRDAGELVRDGAIGDRPASRVRRAWDAWVRDHGDPARLLLGELAALGAVMPHRGGDAPVELSPLALWALREQFRLDGIAVPLLRAPSPRMGPADIVALSGTVSDAEFDATFAAWMRGRDLERAARELLVYAGSAAAQGRLTAVNLVRRLGVAAQRAWRDAMQRPELRGYAWITLATMADHLPESTLPLVLEPDPDDLTGVAADLLSLECGADQPDPEEVAAQFAEAVPEGEEGWVFGLMSQSSQPDVARFLDRLATYHPDRQIARDARKAARAIPKNRRSKPVVPGRAPARTGGR
jgi:hypothetical protein